MVASIMRAALCHHCDVIRSRDVIGQMTIPLTIEDFLYVLHRNEIRISVISFHNVITNVVVTPGSTIRLHPTDAQHVKRSSNSDKNSRRWNILKVMTSTIWRYRVTWRHRKR